MEWRPSQPSGLAGPASGRWGQSACATHLWPVCWTWGWSRRAGPLAPTPCRGCSHPGRKPWPLQPPYMQQGRGGGGEDKKNKSVSRGRGKTSRLNIQWNPEKVLCWQPTYSRSDGKLSSVSCTQLCWLTGCRSNFHLEFRIWVILWAYMCFCGSMALGSAESTSGQLHTETDNNQILHPRRETTSLTKACPQLCLHITVQSPVFLSLPNRELHRKHWWDTITTSTEAKEVLVRFGKHVRLVKMQLWTECGEESLPTPISYPVVAQIQISLSSARPKYRDDSLICILVLD